MSTLPSLAGSSKDAAACTEASGYQFQQGIPPTVEQLRKICGQDDCIQQINRSLLRARNSPSRTEIERSLLNEFAFVAVDFCYYFRKPGEPCAADFLTQFMANLAPLLSACESKSGFSFATNSSNVKDMCGVPECDNVMRRLYVKPKIRTCEPMMTMTGGVSSTYEPVLSNWVDPYRTSCPVADTPTWYLSPSTYSTIESIKYVYLPGPLPGDPPETTQAPNKTMPSPTPSLTPRPSLTRKPDDSSSGSRASTRGSDSGASFEGETVGAPQVTRPARRDDAVVPKAPGAAPTSSSSNSNTLIWTLMVGVAVIVSALLMFVMYRRRQRRAKSLGSSGDSNSNITDSYNSALSSNERVLSNCPQILASQLQDIRILGGGGSGVVYLVRDRGDPSRLLASKRLSRTNASESETAAFVAELTLAASLSHPRIVQFIGIAGLHKSDLQGLFEYMPGGDLCRYLAIQPTLGNDGIHHSWNAEKLQIAIDVADALVYIHSLTASPVVHRDLKSRNIMLTSEKRAKLGDFGVSRTASAVHSMTTGVGTSRWVAPEVIVGGGDYATPCDIYSFGVVLTELDTHRLPFWNLVNANGEPLADFVVLEMVAMQRQKPMLSAGCPSAIRELTLQCLSFEPSDRPGAVEVAESLRRIQHGIAWGKCIDL
jgi:hypothetical protein